jgi:hypothetical protein
MASSANSSITAKFRPSDATGRSCVASHKDGATMWTVSNKAEPRPNSERNEGGMTNVAKTYGGTAHLSSLLRKLKKLGVTTSSDLLRLAAARGCSHYSPTEGIDSVTVNPDPSQISDSELGIAMISAAQEYDPQLMRCAAQLLSSPEIEAAPLVRLAKMERCMPVLAYIARQASCYDHERTAFWQEVLDLLPVVGTPPPGRWPHPSRFMVLSGYRRGGGTTPPIWLRPRKKLKA